MLADVGDFKKWRLTRGTIPTLCPDDLKASCSFAANAMVQECRRKAEEEHMLYQKYEEMCTDDLQKLDFTIPADVYAKAKFGQWKLKMLPLGNLSKVKDKSKASILVEFGGSYFNLSSQTAVKDFSSLFGCK